MNPTNFPRRKEKRKIDAKLRNDEHAALSVKDKIAKLDVKLGVGLGAKKERAKLAALLNKGNQQPVIADETVISPKETKPKKKAKERRAEEGKS